MTIKLKECRLRRNLSIRDLAKISHVSIGMLSDIENHNVIPSILIVCKIANSMGIKMSNELIDCAK